MRSFWQGKKSTLKMLPASWAFGTIEKGSRSLNAKNLGLNALACTSAGMAEAADFFLRTPTLTASKFLTHWSTDVKLLASKDLKLFLKVFNFF